MLRLRTLCDVKIRYLPQLGEGLVINENENFLKLEYEMVENLLSLHMFRLQIPFQECISWFKQDFIYPTELGYKYQKLSCSFGFSKPLYFYHLSLGLLNSTPFPMLTLPKESTHRNMLKRNVDFTEYFIVET